MEDMSIYRRMCSNILTKYGTAKSKLESFNDFIV